MPCHRRTAAALAALLALATTLPAATAQPTPSLFDEDTAPASTTDILPIHESRRQLRVLGLALAGAAIAKLHENGECLFPGGPLCPFPDGGKGPGGSTATAVVNINSAGGVGEADGPPAFVPPPQQALPSAGEASASSSSAPGDSWGPAPLKGKLKHHLNRFDGPPPQDAPPLPPPVVVAPGGSSASAGAANGGSSSSAAGGASASAGAGPHGSATASSANGNGDGPGWNGGGVAIKAESSGNGHSTAVVG